MSARLYLRCSTQEQVVSGLGLEAQREACLQYCQREGLQVVKTYEDKGLSGASPVHEREGLSLLLREVQKGDVVVVAKRDRLARDVYLSALVKRTLAQAGAKLCSAAGEGTGDTPEDELMQTIIEGFAAYERSQIRGRIKAAMQIKRGKNERLGNRPPFGSKVAADGVHLEPCEEELAALQLAKQLWEDGGLSLRKVSQRLAEAGYVNRKGNPYPASQIKRMVDP